MPMDKINEESEDSVGTLKAQLRKLEDDLNKERRLREKIERYYNENQGNQKTQSNEVPDPVTWQMYRQREAEVAKLRTKIELAMSSHEEAMAMAKIQFTQELDRLQKELSSIKEPSATQQAPTEETSVSMIEANFASQKLEIELDEALKQKTNLEYEIKRLRVRLSEETKAKETFETQLKNAMEELDEMHKRLDEEQAARNDLKRSLKAASAELEEWQRKSSETSSERRLSIRMQEVDEAIQKAEITSLTMEKIKLPETNDYPEANASTKLSPEKARRKKSMDFTSEQELQEFKIKFADSEQQLTVWKKKYEELGFAKDGLEDELDLKNSQIQKWEKMCDDLKQQLIEMEKVRHQKIALEEKIRAMTSFVERTEGLIEELEQAEKSKTELREEIKELDNQISDMESSRLNFEKEIQNLKKEILERDEKIENLNAENDRLSTSLEGIRSSYDLQGLGKSSLEQKIMVLNARLVEIQGKYVNEQQEKQELKRIFRESMMGVVMLKAKVECEKIRNVDDFHSLKMQLIERLTETENVFTEAQARARKDLPAHQQSRRASVGLMPEPPALPEKAEYELLEWKEKYDEVCKEIENAEDEVKEMTIQVGRLQVELEEATEELTEVSESKTHTAHDLDSAKSELSDLKGELSDVKGYNEKLNEEIVKLNNTIQEMENAFEDDANARIVEISELKKANEDLRDALAIVSEESQKVKEENYERKSKAKNVEDEIEELRLENENLQKQNRDLEWKFKNLEITLQEESKLQKEADAEVVAAEKKIKELHRMLDESRSKEGDPARLKEIEKKMTDLKHKLKEECDQNEELTEEVGKLKKKLKDVKSEADDEINLKKEEISSLKQELKDASKQVKELKLAMKEAAAAKDLADDEVKNVTKKLKDATIKLEELQKSDKYSADALQSHQRLTTQLRELQTQLDEEVERNERASEEITELKSKLKGIKQPDSELERQIKDLKAALEKEQSTHRDTNDELVNVRKLLKEARKNLDEEKAGINRKKTLRLQESVDDFRSALEEEKEDHAKTSNLLQEIQKELNDANKKISKLRNDIEDEVDSGKDLEPLQRKCKSLQRTLDREQEEHEKTDQKLQEVRAELKSAKWKISDLEAQMKNMPDTSKTDNGETKELREKVKELQSMLSEEQEEHDRTDKRLMKTKRDLEDAKHELSELRKGGILAANSAANEELEEKLREMESALEEERDNFKKTAKNLEKAESQLQAAQMELHELQATDDAKVSKGKKELNSKISELQLKLEERDSTIDELNNALKEERSRVKKTKSNLNDIEDQKDEVEKSLKKKISSLQFELKKYESLLEEEKEISIELRSNLERTERQCDAARDELEEFKKLQKLDENTEDTGIASLRKKLENLHTALDEEMAAHENTESELEKMKEKYNSARKRIDELNDERREGESKIEKTARSGDAKLKKVEEELEEEKKAHAETQENLADFRKKYKVVSIELENVKANLPQEIVDGITTGSANERIAELEDALKIEQDAYEDCLADLESTQKKLKTVKLQLSALKTEQEGSAAGGTKYTSDLKVQLKNLQDALDEELAAHEEVERKYADLKMQVSSAKLEMKNDKGRQRKYSSATVTLSKGLAHQVDAQIEELEEKNEELKKENERFRVEIQVVRAENNKLDQAFNEIGVKYKGGLVTIKELQEAKKELEDENEELKGTLGDLEAEVADLRETQLPSQEKVQRKSTILSEGPDRKELIAENKKLKQRVTDLEDDLNEIRRKSRKPKLDEDEAAERLKEMEAHLNEALMQLEAVEEVLNDEEEFRNGLKATLKDTGKDVEKMKSEYEDSTGEAEQSPRLLKIARRFGGRMSDLEDTVAESQIKLKTVDKYKFKIAELTKELRAYLDQVGSNQGMSAYKWKIKYDALLLQFERSEKELHATKEELASMNRTHNDLTIEMQQLRKENRQQRDRIDELLRQIEELKRQLAEMEMEKKKLEREISELKIAIEELQKTLDDERLRAESKIAELTQERNNLQRELTDKEFLIEQITKSFERQIKDLKNDLELERQTIADYLKHKARMTDLLAQLQAQIEVLSASNAEFSRNNKQLQYKLKEAIALYEDEKVGHQNTRDALARAEKRYRECFKQIDLLRESLERAERMKNRVVGEAESSLSRLDSFEAKASFLESVRLKNEIEIENLKADCEDLEIKARVADEKARNAYAELDEVKLNLRRYMDLEIEARRGKESIEKELRETQIRLAGIEDIDVKQLKNTVKTLQHQNAELEEDLSSVLHQTRGFQRFEERYERRVTTLEIELEEWKNAAELARTENEQLQIKMKKMRAQLEAAESSAMVLSSRYKHAQVDVEDATERAGAAVKALMYKTRGLDFMDGKITTETHSLKVDEESEFETSSDHIQLSAKTSRSPSRR